GGDSPNSAVTTATAYFAVPAAPTGLTATAQADGTVALAWTAPAPNLWYNVYQRDVTAGDTGFTPLPLPVTSGSTLTAGYLTQAHQYQFKVAGMNSAGTGAASAVVTATSSYAVPPVPTALAAAPGDGQVVLTWSSADPS